MSPSALGRVLVAVPTAGRRDIAPLLNLLAAEVATSAGARVLVLDNGVAASATTVAACEAAGAEYARVEAPGLASVRNAALDRAVADGVDALVFLDDDELPVEGWLAAHLAAADRYAADVVLGPVPALLPENPARWLGDGSVLRADTPTARVDGPFDGSVNAGNTLLRMATVTRVGARFDGTYDASGGEDTVFFAAMRTGGATVAWASAALAYETQDADRITFRGWLRRRYEAGQRAVLVERRLEGTSTGQIATRRLARIARGTVTAAAGAVTLRTDRAAQGVGDVAIGVGSLTALAGRTPRSYAPGPR